MTATPAPRRPRRRTPLVLQATLSDCAPACLAMVLAAHGRPGTLAELRDELGAGRDGVPATAIRDAAVARGLVCRSLRVDPGKLSRVPTPFLAHWRGQHFVVVERVTRGRVHVADPALGRRRLTSEQFRDGHTGVVQVLGAGPGRAGAPVRATPPWRLVLGPALRGQHRALGVLAVCAALLLLAGLAVPWLTSRIVARLGSGRLGVPPYGTGPLRLGALDAGLATVIAACLVLALTVGTLSLLRGLAAAEAQRGVGRNLTGSLVGRLLQAPLIFFEHRGRGDVITRVTASEAVRDALATQLVATVLDAVAAVGYTAIVWVLDPLLGLVTAGLGAVQVVAFGALTVRLQRLRREELLAEASSQGWLMETVSGIAWIKAAGAEQQAHRRWQRLHEERLRLLRESARTGAVADAVGAAMRLAGPLVVLLVAGLPVLQAASPGSDPAAVGHAVGLAALATAALLPISSLSGSLRSLQELGSVTAHLGDLMTAPVEQDGHRPAAPPLTGAVDARGLRFRHHRRAPWVVDGVDVSLRPGQKLAVVGPSGSGKSTLARLLIGLYVPDEGQIRIDGRPAAELDVASVRRQIGLVLQEPFLVTGSVRDNIALTHPGASLAEVAEAARLAAIDDDVRRMPAGYDTLVTEGGVGLSGGQRQRIALARALLGRPRLLVLDEATSHVDQATEATIEQNLRGLGVAQIVVAHRLSTVRDADHILVLRDGRVVEEGAHQALLDRDGAYAAMVLATRAPGSELVRA